MAHEITVPLLPCGSIDEIAEFYAMLGFTRTYYQKMPNPYVTLEREDLRLDFFGMDNFEPENSYGTCIVLVPDTGPLFDAFAAGMRAAHGKLLVSGIPRMTRPRKRKNSEGRSGFAVIDPGGNWIRIMAAKPAPEEESPAAGKLTKSLRSAVVMGDSHGKHVRAAEIIDAALERNQDTATTLELVEALAYRAELAARAADDTAAGKAIARARTLASSGAEGEDLAGILASLEDIEAALRTTPSS